MIPLKRGQEGYEENLEPNTKLTLVGMDSLDIAQVEVDIREKRNGGLIWEEKTVI